MNRHKSDSNLYRACFTRHYNKPWTILVNNGLSIRRATTQNNHHPIHDPYILVRLDHAVVIPTRGDLINYNFLNGGFDIGPTRMIDRSRLGLMAIITDFFRSDPAWMFDDIHH